MRILLSNDDGILAPGLAGLYAAVEDLGEVTVVAPETSRSAAGHSITLQQPLKVQHVTVASEREFAGISVDGSPADCVRLAIKTLLAYPPDIVLTGINAGANAGINVFYSGTVAGAAEAVMCGIPAVAFSAAVPAGTADFNPHAVGCLCRWMLERILDQPLRGCSAALRNHGTLAPGELINVNVPVLTPGRPLGVRVVPQSTAELEDAYHLEKDKRGHRTYRLLDEYGFASSHDGTDLTALAEGYITVTPLHVDMTNREELARLEKRDWGKPPRTANSQ